MTLSFPTRRSSVRLDLVVDLLKRASGRHDVLGVIGRIEDGAPGICGRRGRCQRRGEYDKDGCFHDETSEKSATGEMGTTAADADMGSISSAAQSRPRWRSHAAAKPSRPCPASTSSMSR